MKSRNFTERTAQFLQKYGVSGKSALDIGARYRTKYGAGLFVGLQKLGIKDYIILEIFDGYVKDLKSRGYPVIQGDVRKIQEYFQPESFDIVAWIHGPEHLNNLVEICDSIDKLKEITKRWLILSFPIGAEKQGAVDGNPWQKHRYFVMDVGQILGCFGKQDIVHSAVFPRIKYPNAVILYDKGLIK